MAFIEVVCPFCNEADFDLIGLKGHILNGWCDTFNELDTPDEEKLKLKKTATLTVQPEVLPYCTCCQNTGTDPADSAIRCPECQGKVLDA